MMNDKETDNRINDGSAPENALLLDRQLCFPLYACARRITNLYTPFLKKLGITYTQYIVFLVLWEQDGITVGDLCKRLYLDNGTVTPLLKKLEKVGYIRRERSKEDERIVIVYLTDAGKAFRAQVEEVPGQVGSCMHLEEKEAVKLYSLLYKLLDSLADS